GEIPTFACICNGTVPDHVACSCVERDDMQIRRAEVELRTVERHVALRAGAYAFWKPARVMPEFISSGGIESLHVVVVTVNEYHAIMHERRRLVRTGRQAQSPRDTKILRI